MILKNEGMRNEQVVLRNNSFVYLTLDHSLDKLQSYCTVNFLFILVMLLFRWSVYESIGFGWSFSANVLGVSFLLCLFGACMAVQYFRQSLRSVFPGTGSIIRFRYYLPAIGMAVSSFSLNAVLLGVAYWCDQQIVSLPAMFPESGDKIVLEQMNNLSEHLKWYPVVAAIVVAVILCIVYLGVRYYLFTRGGVIKVFDDFDNYRITIKSAAEDYHFRQGEELLLFAGEVVIVYCKKSHSYRRFDGVSEILFRKEDCMEIVHYGGDCWV